MEYLSVVFSGKVLELMMFFMRCFRKQKNNYANFNKMYEELNVMFREVNVTTT